MERVFLQILEYHSIEKGITFKAGQRLENVLNIYLSSVKRILLDAPSLISEASVQDWLSRLDSLIENKRWSELVSFQHRMNIAFGYDKKTMLRQIDLRLHRRLGECHLEQLNYEQAIEQLKYARESAPRDIYVLSRLVEALIKYILNTEEETGLSDFKEDIEELLIRIDVIDPDILYVNPDSAAVAAKYQRRINNNIQEAIRIYRKSLNLNPDSYYLADVLGQTLIDAGDLKEAEESYQKALEIINRIHDYNIWSLATKTTANLVLNQFDRALESANDISNLNPSLNQVESIKGGIVSLCMKLNVDKNNERRLLKKIGGGVSDKND